MSLLLPILLAAIGIGLFVHRMSLRWWVLLSAWIILVLVYNFFKPTAVPLRREREVGLYRNAHVFAADSA